MRLRTRDDLKRPEAGHVIAVAGGEEDRETVEPGIGDKRLASLREQVRV